MSQRQADVPLILLPGQCQPSPPSTHQKSGVVGSPLAPALFPSPSKHVEDMPTLATFPGKHSRQARLVGGPAALSQGALRENAVVLDAAHGPLDDVITL